ncbi:hypothetical protein CK203_070630 [Vitis vinifera]|uniref:Uncharacterized protein n=1 Tax=Vitis vinifera TaxID=29760 RepID=A0A438C1C4_VITVI|nr:hypothetical protein CK203_070630 [Vitis vinifera]
MGATLGSGSSIPPSFPVLGFQRLRGGLGGMTPLDNSREEVEPGKYSPVSEEYHMGPLCSSQSGFFCLGSLVRESLNIGLAKEEGVDPS